MSGERGNVKTDCVDDVERKLSGICDGYSQKDMFNMDETGLFFKDTVRTTLSMFKMMIVLAAKSPKRGLP